MTEQALSPEAVARLREEVGPEEGDRDASSPRPGPPPEAAGPSGARGQVKGVIRKGIAWYVDPTAVDAADAAAERIAGRVLDEIVPRLERLERRLDAYDDSGAEALAINLQLMKGELRTLQGTIGDLGLAIAPAAGLEGAADRMAELRERVNSLERRTRRPAPALSSQKRSPATASAKETDSGFDYLGFEARFRGDPQAVLERIGDRYVELLREHAPVLDIGCGRGELLSVLQEAGVPASGVDLDADMVAEANDRGLAVVEGDAIAHLRSIPQASLGAIISLHVVEHLQLADLLLLLDLARTRLQPGGVFVAETPNPASLIVLGNSYILDPTHVRPLHPSLMVFLCESAGFRDVRLEFYEPARDYHLPTIDDPDAPEWAAKVNDAFERLNHVLFGPQEYAVIATTSL